MRAIHRGLVLVSLCAVGVAVPAMAQSWKLDFGVNAGYAFFTPMMDEEDTGLTDLKFEAGPLVGAQLGFWLGPKLGIRLNSRYADRPLVGSGEFSDTEFASHTNLWAGTADLLIRFKAPAASFTATEVLPYLALGAGLKWHNPANDQFICSFPPEDRFHNCLPIVTGANQWALGERKTFAGLVGLGADWRVARRVAIRTEVSDLIYTPQVYPVEQRSARTWIMQDDATSANLTHEIAGQIGLHFLFGVPSAPPVAVAPAPPPAQPPVEPPPPPPAPRRESISVCVIDPAAAGGIRMQSATLVEGRDTVIVEAGADRPFRDVVGNVNVAGNAPWYVQGQPLVLTVGRSRVEFATYGTARAVDAADLAYVGTINGYPVYADRDDVASTAGQLSELSRSRAGVDLGVILNENRALRTSFEDVRVLYVPTTATGCVFQAVQRQEEVRKGGK